MTTYPGTDVYPDLELYPAGIGGGLFVRGAAASLLRLGAVHVIAAYLGDLLIWDGTISAFVAVPAATATVQAPTPGVQSQPPAVAVLAATATASAAAPSSAVSSTVAVPAATATATAPVPVVSAAVTIAVPPATAAAQAIPPQSDANIAVPPATATATAPVPGVATTGSANIAVPVATAAAAAPAPQVTAAVTIAVPVSTASAAARVPGVAGSSTVAPPAATATATAPVPAATAQNFAPSGMTKNGTMAWTTSSTYVTITSWTANTATYAGSSVTSDRLNVQGTKTNATVSASVPFTGGTFSRSHQVRLVDQSGTVIGSPGSAVSANSGTCTVTATGVNLAGITSIGVQMNASGSSAGTVTSGSTCNLTIT